MTAFLEVARGQLADAGGSTDVGAWPLTRESEPDPLPTGVDEPRRTRGFDRPSRRHVMTHRLITLWGPGGSARPGLRSASRARSRRCVSRRRPIRRSRRHGSGGSVAEAMLAAVQGQRRGEETSTDAVIRALSPTRMLVVLDNCEHLLDEARHLAAEVLQVARTSPARHFTRDAGYPGRAGGRGTSAGRARRACHRRRVVLSSTAAHLFIERATGYERQLRRGPSNARRDRRICRYAGGLPLAVELAAGRLDVDSLGELVTRSGRPAAPRTRRAWAGIRQGLQSDRFVRVVLRTS